MTRITRLVPAILLLAAATGADAQSARCDIPREARDIWRCEDGFVIGPDNVIIRLPIPETDPEALYDAGLAAAQREDWRIAIAYFTAAHQRAHLVPRYMYNLGLAHARAGNEVAAIAWLSAYLIAEPDAPNRAAIWAQIAQLEAAARAKVAILEERALQAAAQLPFLRGGDGGCSSGIHRVATGIARGGDPARAVSLLRRAYAPPCGEPPSTTSSLEDLIRGWTVPEAVEGALADSDPASARRFAEQLTTAQRGTDLDRTLAAPPRLHAEAAFALLEWPSGYTRSDIEADAQSSTDWARVLAEIPGESTLYNEGFLGNLREKDAARVALAALLRGDRNLARTAAERSAQFSRQYTEHGRRSGETGRFYGTGWEAERVAALIQLDRTSPAATVARLQTFMSRQGYRERFTYMYNQTATPVAYWAFVTRASAAGTVASFLVVRGRVDEALAIADDLDSARRLRFLQWLAQRISSGRTAYDRAAIDRRHAEAVRIASGGVTIPPARSSTIEGIVATARTLGGAVYDLDAALASVRQETRSGIQMVVLSGSAEDMVRGIRRVRAAYGHAGGTWGQ